MEGDGNHFPFAVHVGDLRQNREQFHRLVVVAGNANADLALLAGALAQLSHRTAKDQLAMFDNTDVIADFLQFAEDVAGNHDGFAHFLEFAQQAANFDAGAGVKAAGGFIEDKHLGVVDEHAGETQPLLHAAGEAIDGRGLFGLQVGQFQHTFDDAFALARLDAESGGEKFEVFKDFQVVIHAHEVGHVAHQAADLAAVAKHVVAVDIGPAGGGRQQRRQDAHGGGFAGAVGTDKAKDVAGVDGEVQIGQSDQVAIFFSQAGDSDHCLSPH